MMPPFNGVPSKFKEWIKNIEKYVLLNDVAPGRVKFIAFQTSTGCVSDFLQRYLGMNEDITWVNLKAELASRFAEITDSQHAFMLLRKLKQAREESVQMFAERMLTLAEEAYRDQPGGVEANERQLVVFFIDGLLHDYLKMKVMRDNPVSLQEAVNSAMAEQNLRKRFDLRLGHRERTDRLDRHDGPTPMDVDYYRPQNKCFKCNKFGHWAKNCKSKANNIRHVHSVDTPTCNARHTFTCWNCGKPGHLKRNCRKKSKQNQEN